MNFYIRKILVRINILLLGAVMFSQGCATHYAKESYQEKNSPFHEFKNPNEARELTATYSTEKAVDGSYNDVYCVLGILKDESKCLLIKLPGSGKGLKDDNRFIIGDKEISSDEVNSSLSALVYFDIEIRDKEKLLFFRDNVNRSSKLIIIEYVEESGIVLSRYNIEKNDVEGFSYEWSENNLRFNDLSYFARDNSESIIRKQRLKLIGSMIFDTITFPIQFVIGGLLSV